MSKPGFRLDFWDVAMVIAMYAVSWRIWDFGFGPVSWVGAYVVSIFFLFCNVFRIGRRQEIAWSVAFVIVSAAAVLLEWPFWRTVAPITGIAAISVIVWAYRTGAYRGIWHRERPPA